MIQPTVFNNETLGVIVNDKLKTMVVIYDIR